MIRSFFLSLIAISISMYAEQRFSFPKEYAKEEALNIHALDEELALLKKEPFIAVSLGENCFPALHLRSHDIRIRSFPFDWDITPFSALYAILANNFEGFLDLKYLAINAKENTVYNKRYGCKFNHDFDINDWVDGPNGLTPKHEDDLNLYQSVLDRYHRRIARFYAIFDLGIPIYLFRRVIRAEEARKLHTLLSKMFPESTFTLVCIQDERHEHPSAWKDMPENIRYIRLPHPIDHKLRHKNPHATNLFRELGLLKELKK